MIGTGFGDQASSLMLARLGSSMRKDIAARSQEVSTGVVSDRNAAFGGDHARLATLESAHARTQAHLQAARESATRLEVTQLALSEMGEGLSDLRNGLFLALQSGTSNNLDQASDAARAQFSQVVGMLNTQVAGRSLFAGTRTDGPAIVDAETMLEQLRDAISGTADSQDAATAIADWFAPGGGFDAESYLGDDPPGAALTLGAGYSIAQDTTARDPAFRQTLAGLAMAALASEPPAGNSREGRAHMVGAAAGTLSTAIESLTGAAEALGRDEARVAGAESAAQAELATLDRARVALLEADPYEAAARLEETMSRLEALLVITARSSRLSLTGYLR